MTTFCHEILGDGKGRYREFGLGTVPNESQSVIVIQVKRQGSGIVAVKIQKIIDENRLRITDRGADVSVNAYCLVNVLGQIVVFVDAGIEGGRKHERQCHE